LNYSSLLGVYFFSGHSVYADVLLRS